MAAEGSWAATPTSQSGEAGLLSGAKPSRRRRARGRRPRLLHPMRDRNGQQDVALPQFDDVRG
jgi:hypothetical protein